jgi:hypothetical protein
MGSVREEVPIDRAGISLQDAVRQHLLESGIPADGGINDTWVVVRLGPIPFCFPNTNMRRKTVPIHDLNHVLSGYGHDAVGEAEIGAWELGGGCKGYWAAWILNWSALVPGMLKTPTRMLRAFARGRQTGNLYRTNVEDLRCKPVAEVRKALGLDRQYPVRVSDFVLFAGIVVLSPVAALIPALAAILTSPIWLLSGAQKKRRTMAEG